ncbi:peptide chain release factor N(5)-glutamine methyltransferase [Lautropia mirabilis]
MTSPTLDDLIRHSQLPRAEARRLLASLTGQPLTWFMAHGDDPADPDITTHFQALAERRRAGEPLAYLLGQQEFYGRPFTVSPAVLIPRADTETLVETALEQLLLLRGQRCAVPPSLLELGTGSGIIAITLALEAPDTDVHAVERSPEALAVAQQNAKALGADRIHWHAGSWWQALACPTDGNEATENTATAAQTTSPITARQGHPTEPPARRFDLIVSNPPYIAAHDHHLQQGDLRFEPPQALAAGPDGLDDLRIIIGGAPAHLNPGGWLLLEHGYDQEAPVQALLRDAGFADVFTRRDLAGQPRVSGGQWQGDGRK